MNFSGNISHKLSIYKIDVACNTCGACGDHRLIVISKFNGMDFNRAVDVKELCHRYWLAMAKFTEMDIVYCDLLKERKILNFFFH